MVLVRRKYRVSRKLGGSLWGRSKDPVNKLRNYPPGQHGNSLKLRKMKDYGKQFNAHKKFKYYYNLGSKQLRNLFLKARAKKGDTIDNFVASLESLLNTVVYNSGFVPTVYSAQQLISHKHVTVNDKIVNIKSYKVKVGDVIKIRDRAVNLPMVIGAMQSKEHRIPDYLEVNADQRSIKFLRVPKYSEVPYAMNMEASLVIEFYSR